MNSFEKLCFRIPLQKHFPDAKLRFCVYKAHCETDSYAKLICHNVHFAIVYSAEIYKIYFLTDISALFFVENFIVNAL